MPTPSNVMRGKNVRVSLFIDGVPQDNTEFATTCEIKEDAELHKDSYLGRLRSKADKTLNGYDCTLECDVASMQLVKNLEARDKARDENRPIPVLALKLEFTQRDGQEVSVLLSDVEAKQDLSMKGRTDAITTSLELFAEERETL